MKERNEFIDFIKGICITLVVTEHYLFFKIGLEHDSILWPFWGKCAVPLFLCIQSYLVFKKEKMNLRQDTIKMLKSIALPYIIAEAIQITIIYILGKWNAKELITAAIKYNGIGLGTYYFWIYLQFFILTRIIKIIEDKKRLGIAAWGFLLITISLLNAIHANDNPQEEANYAINSLQYIFLIWIGMVIAKWGWRPKMNWALIVLGAASVYIFNYQEVTGVVFYITEGAPDRQFPAYLYHTFFFGGVVLWTLYNIAPTKIRKMAAKIGQNTWWIYCIQMMWFTPNFVQTNNYKAIIGYGIVTAVICIYLPTKMKPKIKEKSPLRGGGETP